MSFLRLLKPQPVLRIPRISVNDVQQFRRYETRDMVLDGPARMAAFRDLTNRVNNQRECWAWQIQSLVFMISMEGNYGRTSLEEATYLMRACQADILDLFPSEQKILTELAWDSVKSAHMKDSLAASLYNNMILAFIFQNLDIDDSALMERMRTRGVSPNNSTYNYLVEYLCRRGQMGKAQEYLEESMKRNLPLTEQLVKSLILGHASAGEIKEGENLLKLLNKKNIHWGKSCYESFVLGSAKYGDVEATEFFLEKFGNPSDHLVLSALQEMHENHPDKIRFLLNKMPQDIQNFSGICRRTVKILLERGDEGNAWEIVMKSRDVKENNSDKERVVKISPSVIVLKNYLSKSKDVEKSVKKIHELLSVDPKIVGRSITILVDICFEDKSKIEFAKRVIDEILLNITDADRADARNYIGQNSKRRMFKAESEEEIYNVFEIFCGLGLKLEKIRAWDVMMKKLLPMLPEEGTWTQARLLKKVHDVKDNLSSYSNINGNIYSHSVIWGIILQSLLNRENDIFFAIAAKLCNNIKVAYAPKRWHLSLANCLIKLKDVQSFVDILEVSFKNSVNKGNTNDFCLVASSLCTAITRGKKWKIDTDSLLSEVLDEIWRRGIKLPPEVRDEMIRKLRNDNIGLSNSLENIPVLGRETFSKPVNDYHMKGRIMR